MITGSIVHSVGCRFLPLILMLLLVADAEAHVTSYFIGNSLTWDSQPLGVAAIANSFGFDQTVGHHIRCGSPLNAIIADPSDICVDSIEEFGTFIQPHPSATFNPTLLSDETSILTFINTALTNGANSDTTFYIYSAWPRIANFETDWTSAVADVDTTPTIYAREYFEHLFNRVTAATSAKVALIPVGEVLYELDQRMEAGEFPGFTDIAQFYRDGLHLTVDLGRYTAGLTTFATLFETDPTGSTKPAGFYGEDSAFSPAIYSAIQGAVWDVVSANPYSGALFSPADFQRDGEVDAADLALWESSFGNSGLGDADGDGDVDGGDFLAWQRRFEGTLVSSVATVPEPNTLALLVLVLTGPAGMRCCRIKKQSFRI